MDRPILNFGHGHVFKRADGIRSRCGGPGLCRDCKAEQVALERYRKINMVADIALNAGVEIPDAATMLGFAPRTITRWSNAFLERGVAGLMPSTSARATAKP